MSIRERQLAFIVKEIRAAESVGHTLTVDSFTNPGRDRQSYRARCSCGWEQRKSSSQNGAFIQLMIHVGSVSPLGQEDVDEARRVGLVLPETVAVSL